MKILIAGLGSIGQRHARTLRTLLGERLELLAYRVQGGSRVIGEAGGATTPEEAFGIRSFRRLDEALAEKPDAVFVTNPTALHLPVAQAAAEAGCHLFVEKPLAHEWEGIERLIATVERRDVVAMVGHQLRFHPGLSALRSLLADRAVGRPLAAQLEFGEYLPAWHPWEDYRQSYAARPELGGGVLLSQLHDLDYACWLFGMPARVYAVGGHLSSLEIGVEDVASVTLECRDEGRLLPVHVHMDYLQRPPVRTCRVIGEEGRLLLDVQAGTLTVVGVDGRTVERSVGIDRNELFVREVRHFLACIAGTEQPLVTLRTAAESQRVALAARASIASGKPVELPSVHPPTGRRAPR
ncbi:MAG: Gfo/Idh/MocA family oxidoreductase [Candidatus Rokubacteria bacterium]|nr:Gfo/Idh/MocA family oxidoreductase [Candidatus Rokubacteria bacterium]